MAGPSRSPIVEHEGSLWLGHPQSPDLRIRIDADGLCFQAPSGDRVVPWAEIRELHVDVPTANWTLARVSQRVLATLDNLQAGTSGGVNSAPPTRFGTATITVTAVLASGETVTGWSRMHQPFGYPPAGAAAAQSLLQERVPHRGADGH